MIAVVGDSSLIWEFWILVVWDLVLDDLEDLDDFRDFGILGFGSGFGLFLGTLESEVEEEEDVLWARGFLPLLLTLPFDRLLDLAEDRVVASSGRITFTGNAVLDDPFARTSSVLVDNSRALDVGTDGGVQT